MVTKELKCDADYLNPGNYSRNFLIILPHPLDLSDMNMAAEKFQIWRLKCNDFCTITNLKQQSPEYQLAIFRQSVGDDALKAIQKFMFQPYEDRNDWYVLMEKLEALCIGDRNETYERYKFFSYRQEDGESFESYLNAIKHLVEI